MKRTPFYSKHIALGAKMVEFGGFEMPVQYPSGIIAEHKAVRTGGGGIFDVSHMGEFFVTGREALPFLQTITTNDVALLAPGKAQYSCMPKENGGIIDDLIVYMLKEHEYMVVVNGATAEKDWAWFTKQAANFDVTLDDQSDNTSLLAIQGKNAKAMLQAMTDVDLDAIEYYHFAQGKLAGVDMIISRTGYTGEPGFEIYFSAKPEVALKVWDEIAAAAEKSDIIPVGLGARDTLRLEMGYCLYGNDITENTSPLEAGLSWITKLKKPVRCLAFDAIEELKAKGVDQKLTGLLIDEKGAIARHGYPIYSSDEKQIGTVTSGNISPMLNKAIALGYLAKEHAAEGTEVFVEIRAGKRAKAVVTKPPFVKPEVKE